MSVFIVKRVWHLSVAAARLSYTTWLGSCGNSLTSGYWIRLRELLAIAVLHLIRVGIRKPPVLLQ
jgi:hypothetical protein